MIDQPSARLRLAAELAVGLARRLWMTLGPDATDAGFCWHHFQNPFEDAFAVLWELGVALAATESDDQGMTRQQYAVYATQHPGEEHPCSLKFFPAPEHGRACLPMVSFRTRYSSACLRPMSTTRATMAPMGRSFVQIGNRSSRRLNSSARSARSSSADTPNVVGTWSSGLTKSLL